MYDLDGAGPHREKEKMSVTAIPEPMQRELEEVRYLTENIRDHQRAIEEIAEERRSRILVLRANRITYREIAASMRVTEQSVYKCLKPSIDAAKSSPGEPQELAS